MPEVQTAAGSGSSSAPASVPAPGNRIQSVVTRTRMLTFLEALVVGFFGGSRDGRLERVLGRTIGGPVLVEASAGRVRGAQTGNARKIARRWMCAIQRRVGTSGGDRFDVAHLSGLAQLSRRTGRFAACPFLIHLKLRRIPRYS